MQDGFDALYREQYAAIRRFVTSRLGGAGVDDIVSTTFELAYGKLPDRHPHPVGWLFRTASHLVAAENRRQEKERRALRDVAVLHAPQGQDRDVEILSGILDRLPRAHREVLTLTYWDRLAAADVAVVLGCSEQAVWKRISRAKAAIRKEWPGDDVQPTWEEVMTGV